MAEIKKRILAVDDDSVTRMLVKCALKTDYEVIDAEDTDIALSNIKDTLPDLILLDINMPGENGFSFFSLLKTNSEWSKIPVIFLTGMSDSCTETSCFDSGAYDYIAKPVNPQILRHRIARVLEYAVLRKKNSIIEQGIQEENAVQTRAGKNSALPEKSCRKRSEICESKRYFI